MKEYLSESDRLKAVTKDAKEQMERVGENENAIRELLQAEAHTKKEYALGQQKLFNLKKQFETKKTQAQMALSKLQQDKAALQRDLAADRAKAEHLDSLCNAKRREVTFCLVMLLLWR